MNDEPNHQPIEPELEARIVALVLGEASDFEREELNRLIALRPELATFQLSIQHLHGMLTEVGHGEFEAPSRDWKLPSDKRNAVLAALRGEATVDAVVAVPSGSMTKAVASSRSWKWNFGHVAVAVCVLGFMGILALPTWMNERKLTSDSTSSISNFESGLSSVALVDDESDQANVWQFESQPSKFQQNNSQLGNSKAALSAIQDTLQSELKEPTDGYFADAEQVITGGGTLERIPDEDDFGVAMPDFRFGDVVANTTRSKSPVEISGMLFYDHSPWGADNVNLIGEDALGRQTDPNAKTNSEADSLALPQVSMVDQQTEIAGRSSELELLALGEQKSSGTGIQSEGVLFGSRDFEASLFDFDSSGTVWRDAVQAGGGILAPSTRRLPTEMDQPFGENNKGISSDTANPAPPDTAQPRKESTLKRRLVEQGGDNIAGTNRTGRSKAKPNTDEFDQWTRLQARSADDRVGVDFDFNIQDTLPLEPNLEVAQNKANESAGGTPFGRLYVDTLVENAPRDLGLRFRIMEPNARISGSSETSIPQQKPADDQSQDDGVETHAGRRLKSVAELSWKPDAKAVLIGKNAEDSKSQRSSEELAAGSKEGETNSGDQQLRASMPLLLQESLLTERLEQGDPSLNAIRQQIELTREYYKRQSQKDVGGAGIAAPTSGLADLTGTFSDLMAQNRFAEAELVVKKAKDVNGDSPQIQIMLEKGKLERQIAAIADIKTRKADSALEQLNSVEESQAFQSFEYRPLNPKSWESLERQRRTESAKTSSQKSTLERSLSEQVTLKFKDVALQEILREIATKHDINILLDNTSVPSAGVNANQKLSIDVDGITLRSAIHLLLQQAGDLESYTSGEVLKITKRDLSLLGETDGLKWKRKVVNRSTASAGLNEKMAATEAFSTFSLHVSDVSFQLAKAALEKSEWPEAAKIRIEEFVNAFNYADPMPRTGEKVACVVEQSIHPFLQQRNLLRVSMKTAAAGRANSTSLRLTLLLDNSGSMERIDRQQTVRRAFSLLAKQLKPSDHVTLISFARQPRLLADMVSGEKANQLVELIDQLPSEGGTNIEAALRLAFDKAKEHQSPGAQNRIILLTDGAVNLGNANPESLSDMVKMMRTKGIAFDAAGISAEGLNDEVLEALTRQGDGRYYLLDSAESADSGFAAQIAGALRPSAKNVKVQVEFNPKRVGKYKLLGFRKHRLNKEDFRNDKVDAAEMAAAEAGVAMYQFEPMPDGEGDVGSVSVRFLDLSSGQMVEHRWPIPYVANASRTDQANPSLRIATSAALLAAKLRNEPLGESVDLQTLAALVSGLPEAFDADDRVQSLQRMIEQARQLSDK